MKNLTKFVDQENRMRKLFGDTPIDIQTLTNDTVQDLFLSLDRCLSIEALTMDGERPQSQVQKLRKEYMGAVKELVAMGYRPVIRPYHFDV